MVASDHDPVSATAIGTFARAVETSGFSRLYLTDHIFHATPTFHSTSAFAVAAAATRNIPLGFCAYIVPFRHPIVAAKELAFLDGLCEGRLLAGLATGSSRAEMDALGVDFVSRGRRLDEALKAMLALWQNDEVSFEGEFFNFDRVSLRPKPVQRPHPPIWFGSWTGPKRAARRIARHAAGWQSSGLHTSIEQVSEGWKSIEEACAEIGRDPQELGRAHVNVVTRIGSDRASALAALPPSHRMHDELVLAGPPAQIVDSLQEMYASGVDEVALFLPCSAVDQLEQLAEHVLPAVLHDC